MDDEAPLWFTIDADTRERIARDYDAAPLSQLGISTRPHNALRRGGFRTIGAVIRATSSIVHTRNLGVKSLSEIDAAVVPIIRNQKPRHPEQHGTGTKDAEQTAPDAPTVFWGFIDQTAASNLAHVFQRMPVHTWSVPVVVVRCLSGLGCVTVGDVLRDLAPLQANENLSPSHMQELFHKVDPR